jgi:hypothetical protein
MLVRPPLGIRREVGVATSDARPSNVAGSVASCLILQTCHFPIMTVSNFIMNKS